jgi:uncharacterized membrane protein
LYVEMMLILFCRMEGKEVRCFMKAKIFLAIFFVSVLLVGCGQAESKDEASSSKETEVKNVRELVSDYSSDKSKDEKASITSQELIIMNSDGEETAVHDLSGEDFFVSIAPYENETHP